MRAAQEVPVLLVGYFWNNFHLVPIQILSFKGGETMRVKVRSV